MYLVETGFGQVAEARPRRQAPKDRLDRVNVTLTLQVLYRKDLAAFRQEVVTAIKRHVVAPNDKKKIDGLMTSGANPAHLKDNHDFYSFKIGAGTAKPGLNPVVVNLTCKEKNYTGLKDAFILSSREIDLSDI